MNRIKSLIEAQKEFSTPIKCEVYLTKMRWPDGVECPRCNSKRVTRLSTRRKWQCKECRYQFSVTSGSVLHGSHIDLPRWMVAVWLMCHSPKGVSSKQLERELGVTYKSAWYLAQRIRRAMKTDVLARKLSGIIEIDDAVLKSDRGKRWGGGSHVVGMASRDGDLRMIVLNKLRGEEIRRVVAENVEYVQAFYTDAHALYRKMHELGPHQYVVHQKQWVDGEVHVSFVENAWSLFKRALVGVYHHVSTRLLQDYLDEFAFRYRHRHEKHLLMDLVLENC